LTWEQADQALNRFDSLSPYDPKLVPHLFKKEDESFAADGKTQMELRYFGISSKNYVLFRGTPQNPEIIKPSQHGLGTYFRPDPRPWIRAKNCVCTDKYRPMAFEDWKIILRQ